MAGAIWGLTFFKPQLLLIPLFISMTNGMRREFKPLLGLVACVFLLLATNAFVFGFSSFTTWLNGMHVVDAVYSEVKNGVVMPIVASVPRMIILSTPQASKELVKVALLVFCIALFGLDPAGRAQNIEANA